MKKASHQVPIFRELVFRGASTRLDELGPAIERYLVSPWLRDAEQESSSHLGDFTYLVFRRGRGEGRLGVEVIITTHGNDAYVARIAPGEVGEISQQEYNQTLSDFADRFARPAADDLGIEVEVTGEHVDLSELLDETSYRALVTFSRAANRGAGSSHPLYRRRWFSFIWSVHRSGRDLPWDLLTGWLELHGWDEETAGKLASEYDYSISLLRHPNDA